MWKHLSYTLLPVLTSEIRRTTGFQVIKSIYIYIVGCKYALTSPSHPHLTSLVSIIKHLVSETCGSHILILETSNAYVSLAFDLFTFNWNVLK